MYNYVNSCGLCVYEGVFLGHIWKIMDYIFGLKNGDEVPINQLRKMSITHVWLFDIWNVGSD